MTDQNDEAEETDPRAITEEQWHTMGKLGRELRSLVVRRGRELGLPLDKAGTTVLLMLVHTAEPSWSALQLRERLDQMLDIAFELRGLGTLETLFGPALRLDQPDPPPPMGTVTASCVATNRDKAS